QITSSRKVHSVRIPRLGGIAIVAGFYAPLLALILYPTGLGSVFYADGTRSFAFLFGGLAIAGLGIFDDIFGCGAVEKFLVQIAVALYLWFAGFRMAALAGSLLGFLRFNFNPATIFMGDGGSLFIGYVLAVSAIRTNQKSSAAVSLLVPIVALALPIGDTLLAMVRRGLRGRPMFSGDREHIHHRLLALGLSHREVVLLLYAVAVSLGGLSIAIASYAP